MPALSVIRPTHPLYVLLLAIRHFAHHPVASETFGKVTDCVIMCDPHTRKPRGFGFITYDNGASVDRVCANKFHDLNGLFLARPQ